MLRRSVLESVGLFDTSLRSTQDYDLFLRISRRFPVCCHDGFVLEYRQHEASMSVDNRLMLAETVRVSRRQWTYARRTPEHRAAYSAGKIGNRRHYGERLVEDWRRQLKGHRWRTALQSTSTLLSCYPSGLISAVRRSSSARLVRSIHPKQA